MDSGVVNSIDAFSEVKSADLIGVSYGPVTIPSFFLSFLSFPVTIPQCCRLFMRSSRNFPPQSRRNRRRTRLPLSVVKYRFSSSIARRVSQLSAHAPTSISRSEVAPFATSQQRKAMI